MEVATVPARDLRTAYVVGDGAAVSDVVLVKRPLRGGQGAPSVPWANVRLDDGRIIACSPDHPVEVRLAEDGF